MKHGAIPILNMPKKSIETANSKEREPRNIVKDYPVKQSIFYTNIDESKSKLSTYSLIRQCLSTYSLIRQCFYRLSGKTIDFLYKH